MPRVVIEAGLNQHKVAAGRDSMVRILTGPCCRLMHGDPGECSANGLFDLVVVLRCRVSRRGAGSLHLFKATTEFLELPDGALVASVQSSLDLLVNCLRYLAP